jgi:hypothetical protein
MLVSQAPCAGQSILSTRTRVTFLAQMMSLPDYENFSQFSSKEEFPNFSVCVCVCVGVCVCGTFLRRCQGSIHFLAGQKGYHSTLNIQ